ncbi:MULTISPECIES: hypothetical protein [unclassified Vibrio]|uniref:Uncharacterized protein n=1 Tax=Vibrio sp. HB236076 TaxID=3232307 RepID=A0AB39HJZ6_9VIBR|nr:hypothetical protein [Vibrio sp. HB161653]MDP5252850.1 hypothetical protein [Vibrio sp. HB161653]
MAISGIGSGYSMLQQSQQMASSAAETLANNSNNQKLDTPSQDLTASGQQNPNTATNQVLSAEGDAKQASSDGQNKPTVSNLDALLTLNQAQNYNAIGAKVIENSNERLGNLIDIQA